MAFVPRTFEQIRDDMMDFVRVHTDVTDFEVGSVIRTIIEAASLEDDEQYFQMVQLMDAFKLQTATGTDLEERVAEYGIVRLQAATSAGELVVRDELLIKSTLSLAAAAAATTTTLVSSLAFPTSGFPYNVRIGEGTLQVEDVVVSANNTGTGVLTHSALVNNHDVAERVAFVSGVADRAISSGLSAQVPATSIAAAIVAATTEAGTLVNGNYESTAIGARMQVPGTAGNVGAGRVVAFTSAPPFSGASVTNTTSFAGGRNVETDAELRDRARQQIQTLTRATVLALKQAALGTADEVTGQRVTTANVLEDMTNDEVILYIDDGTGFTPDTVELARSTLSATYGIGVSSITVVDASEFPAEGAVVLSPENPAQIELVHYSAVNYTTNVLTLTANTLRAHDLGDEAVLVDEISGESGAEAGQNFFHTSHFPLVRASERLWIDTGTGLVLKVSGELGDYLLQRGTGQIEVLGAGLPGGSIVVVGYTYYTGLVATVQTIIDGDANDPVTYPGVRAAGVIVVVETPTIRRITVRISISAQPGFVEADLIPQVREAVETYISGLGLGADVIIAEIIERSMGVTGVYNVSVITPVADVVILENELPVPFSAGGVSLITVT